MGRIGDMVIRPILVVLLLVSAAIAQVAAEILNCEVERIRVVEGDSDSPDGGPTNASRTVYMGAGAVHQGATALKEEILKRASEMADVPREQLFLEEEFSKEKRQDYLKN